MSLFDSIRARIDPAGEEQRREAFWARIDPALPAIRAEAQRARADMEREWPSLTPEERTAKIETVYGRPSHSEDPTAAACAEARAATRDAVAAQEERAEQLNRWPDQAPTAGDEHVAGL